MKYSTTGTSLLISLILLTTKTYGIDRDSVMLSPQRQTTFWLSEGQRATVSDYRLYLDGVEHREKTLQSNNGVALSSAPARIQVGIFFIDSLAVGLGSGNLIIDGPASLQLYRVNPRMTGNILQGVFERTFADSEQPTRDPFVAFTVSKTPSDTSTSVTPSNTIVIPENASGTVEVVLESSVDLVDWTRANPGFYGSSTARRFFRLRAIEQ